MGKKTATNHTNVNRINSEILSCIEKLHTVKLFKNEILCESEEYELLKNSKSEDVKVSKKAVEKLSRCFFKFSFKHAIEKFRLIGGKINLDDLVSEANIGILIAIKNFQLNKWGIAHENGVKLRFSTYARWWIKSYLNDYCIKNSSMIKFCTTKDDEKVFYKIGDAIKKLNIEKKCCELDNNEIQLVANKLKVNTINVKRYINCMNVSNSEKETEIFLANHSFDHYEENQEKIDNNIDKNNFLLSNKQLAIYNSYIEGHNLEKIAKKYQSNKETIRQSLILSAKKIYPEKKIN
tara:strand:+ start:1421 stop:2299 length:879 start_codon:yes stop_codon:yes gene_type:complete